MKTQDKPLFTDQMRSDSKRDQNWFVRQGSSIVWMPIDKNRKIIRIGSDGSSASFIKGRFYFCLDLDLVNENDKMYSQLVKYFVGGRKLKTLGMIPNPPEINRRDL